MRTQLPADEELLHTRFFEHCRQSPEDPALRTRAGDISYGELGRQVERFASQLLAHGFEPGGRVAVLLDNGPEYPIAIYGTLAAGGVVVPLCPDSKGQALRWMLGHADVQVLVSGPRSTRLIVSSDWELPPKTQVIVSGSQYPKDDVRFTGLDEVLATTAPFTPPTITGEALAAIHYTSGTTGHPKGVMLEHRQLTSNVRSIIEYLGLVPRDVIGLTLPLYYAYGSSVLHTHLASGACIAFVSSLAYAQRSLEELVCMGATGFSGVPASFAKLVPLQEKMQLEMPALRYLTQAGAGMSKQLTQRALAAWPEAELYIMYGQTEASARLAWLPPDRLAQKLGSAGKPIPGVELSIIDSEGNPVPPGQDGEVLARGPSIMRGYWRDPEASAKALRFGGLCTGDIGHLDEDGFLWLIGRQSELIKSGGHRIGPGEIEAALLRHPAVAECGVAGYPDEELGEAIHAFVVLAEGTSATATALQRHCLKELPRFKLPSAVHFVQELPRTASGKLQRRRLSFSS
ncbi:MAG: AMP-dependent synthetase [Planctomycetota bacterium]|nr:MAG: AMP-dependent synthetase [Planctomycetota bacterium]